MIEPVARSQGRTGYLESFNARLRDELLNGESFYSLREAQVVIESWHRHYNAVRPHASLEADQLAREVQGQPQSAVLQAEAMRTRPVAPPATAHKAPRQAAEGEEHRSDQRLITAQTRGRPALVSLAPPSPAARTPRALAQTAALHTALT